MTTPSRQASRWYLGATALLVALGLGACGPAERTSPITGDPSSASKDFFVAVPAAEVPAEVAGEPAVAAARAALDAGSAHVVKVNTYLFGHDRVHFNLPGRETITLRRLNRQDRSSRAYTWTGTSEDGTATGAFDVDGKAVDGAIQAGALTVSLRPVGDDGYHLVTTAGS